MRLRLKKVTPGIWRAIASCIDRNVQGWQFQETGIAKINPIAAPLIDKVASLTQSPCVPATRYIHTLNTTFFFSLSLSRSRYVFFRSNEKYSGSSKADTRVCVAEHIYNSPPSSVTRRGSAEGGIELGGSVSSTLECSVDAKLLMPPSNPLYCRPNLFTLHDLAATVCFALWKLSAYTYPLTKLMGRAYMHLRIR